MAMDETDSSSSKSTTKVIVTNHKTGTGLMRAILRKYCATYQLTLLELNQHLRANEGSIDPALDFQKNAFIFVPHAQQFMQLLNAAPKLRYRVVHLIRNPYEIIMSGVRYHQITKEAWCNQKVFVADEKGCCGFRRLASGEAGDYTYREIMNALPEAEKIAFEMRQQATPSGTIIAIKRFLERFREDENVTSIRLEDIATVECVDHVFRFLGLNEAFLGAYRRSVGKQRQGAHITNPNGKSTYESSFNEDLYDLFSAEFGTSVLRAFGYARKPPVTRYFRDPASGVFVSEPG